MDLSAHSDGWISVQGDDGLALHVRIRYDGDNRVVITGAYYHADEITPAAVRDMSISRLQAELTAAMHYPSGSAATVLGLAAATAGSATFHEEVQEPTLAELRARLPIAGRTKRTERLPRPRLTRPAGADPEEFYPLVARAYLEYATQTRAPAKEIAAEAGVPITTVHRWIREARRRGFLPPARKGKAG